MTTPIFIIRRTYLDGDDRIIVPTQNLFAYGYFNTKEQCDNYIKELNKESWWKYESFQIDAGFHNGN